MKWAHPTAISVFFSGASWEVSLLVIRRRGESSDGLQWWCYSSTFGPSSTWSNSLFWWKLINEARIWTTWQSCAISKDDGNIWASNEFCSVHTWINKSTEQQLIAQFCSYKNCTVWYLYLLRSSAQLLTPRIGSLIDWKCLFITRQVIHTSINHAHINLFRVLH